MIIDHFKDILPLAQGDQVKAGWTWQAGEMNPNDGGPSQCAATYMTTC